MRRAAQALASRRPAQARALHHFDPQRRDVSVGVSGGAAARRHSGADELPARRRDACRASCAMPAAAPSSAARSIPRPAATSQTCSAWRFGSRPTLRGPAGIDYREPGRQAAGHPHGRADGVRRHRVPALHLGIDRHAQGHRAHPRRHDLGHRAQPDILAAGAGGSHDRGGADVSQERDARLGQAVAARGRLARHHAQLRSAAAIFRRSPTTRSRAAAACPPCSPRCCGRPT